MSVRLADRSFQYPIGIAENMLVEVGKFTFPVDFVILEIEEDRKVPLILRPPFFTLLMHIDVIDEILEEYFDALPDEGSKILHSIEGTVLEEEIFSEFDKFIAMASNENNDSESDKEEPKFKKITINTNYKIKTSLEEPPTDLELKPLPDNLKYVFLEEPSFRPVIISSQLSAQNKSKLDIDFMGPFPKSHKFEYILVAIDYVSKWAEAQALPTNDARVVIISLKKLFYRFGMPKALISDRGTHFCNKIMEKTMKRYGVNHRLCTSYHPQTSGQVKNTNRALKRILEKTVKDNPAIWSRKLDDALWAFRTAYKTPTSTTPYKLIYGKNCHLPFEIEHRAYWALKNCNSDLIAAGEKRIFQLHELDKLRHQAYENSQLYKARTKVWHDRKLRMRKEFKH
ncbi:reverse transcriptase domain-containing protein [Tanacetum coccineum]